MNAVQRMAGDYKIFLSLHVGDKEIVVGEDTKGVNGRYMCGFCATNDLFSLYNEIAVSDDYLEIVELYGNRVAEQAEKARAEAEATRMSRIEEAPITAQGCTPIACSDNIEGKVIVSKNTLNIQKRSYILFLTLFRPFFKPLHIWSSYKD